MIFTLLRELLMKWNIVFRVEHKFQRLRQRRRARFILQSLWRHTGISVERIRERALYQAVSRCQCDTVTAQQQYGWTMSAYFPTEMADFVMTFWGGWQIVAWHRGRI